MWQALTWHMWSGCMGCFWHEITDPWDYYDYTQCLIFDNVVITCVHPFINNNKSKFWHNVLDHKKYLVVFFTYYPLSKSLRLCIHSRITSFYCYQDDIFCTHWSEDSFGGGLHCDETLNVIVLTYVMTWVSHMTWYFAFSLWQDPNCHSFRHQNTSLTCDVNFFDT